MAARCVNIHHPEFKALEKELGFNMAHSLTIENDYNYPTLDEAVAMIRGTKVRQFKSAIAHMRNLKASTVEELLKGFNGIVRKYGDNYYVVNGSRISEAPAPTSAAEVEQANIRFLEAVNDTFGNIFKLTGTPGTAQGIKLITGNEQLKEGTILLTTFDESNLIGEVTDDVASFRSSNNTMSSPYLKNAQWFAEGFIPGPKSMRNNVKLPYANKTIAAKLVKLRDEFNNLGTSKTAKEKKEQIKNRMFEIADKAVQGFKDAIKANLNALFTAWDSKLIDRSRHWYDGANRVAQNFSSTYGLSIEATSGVMAVLSPQNEWFNNISAADRVMNVMKNHLTTPVTAGMYDVAIRLSKGEPFEVISRAMKQELEGRSLSDILGLADTNAVYKDIAANLLRIIDMNVHGPEVYVVSPEGVASGIKTDVGGLVRFAWGSTSEIFKAISIFQNPSIENISEKIGKGNKVRNFYNNIVSPNSEKGQVTVDTHAMAAAFLNVISAEEASAMNLFRTGGSPIYAIIKEAYQEIAKEKGLRPREVQSITWEAIRLLIKDSDKTDTNREEINNIWKQVQNKKLSHEQAISDIIGRFSFSQPQWNRATNQGGNRGGVQSTEDSVQQRERSSDNLWGQQPATGESATGLAERTVEENESLLAEVEGKTTNAGYKATIQAARDSNDLDAGVQYFIDKAVENPDKFDRDFGEEMTDKFLNFASNDKIEASIADITRLNTEDDPAVTLLRDILKKRSEKKVAPGKALFSEPNEESAQLEETYQRNNGLSTDKGSFIYSLDVEFSKKVADAFEAMEHNPNDPNVKAAYEAMAEETIQQFRDIQNAGYTVEIYEGKGEPYKNSQEMITDVRENKHQYILSTEKDFGQNSITDQQREENPLLRDSGEKDVNGKPLLVNDIFRYVHDFFGHTVRGNSFGPVGEENAWDVHARMYSPLARRAMTTETRGQNSWVNFGKHMRNEDGSIKKKGEPGYLDVTERPYAERKLGLLPEDFSKLPEELGQERVGVKPHPQAVKVEIDEQLLSDFTQVNQEEIKDEEVGWKPFGEDVEFQKLNEEYFSAEQKKRFSLDNVIRMLKSKFGVKVVVVNEPGSFWRGKYQNGVITINEAYVTPDTPFHEVMHGFMDVLKKENPELYAQLMDEVKNSESGKSAFEYVNNAYPELNEEQKWEETLVMELGRMSGHQDLQNKEQTIFGKFVDWLKTVLAKMGIMTQNFRTNMSLQEFANLIVNPSFVFDLNNKIREEDHAERYSKLSNNFDEVINVVKQKLQADAASRTKNMSEDTSRRKFFSGKTAEALTADPRDLKAIDNFILSSAANLKRLNEKFEQFKQQFDMKKTKSKDDLATLSQLLNEIEDCVTLYEDVDLLISSVMDEFPDAEDSIGNLKKNYRREAALINDYKSYAKELIVNWLFPHGSSAINTALATDRPFTVVSKTTYEAVQKELQAQGITNKRQILETAFRRELAAYITTAKKDASAITQFLGPILHSRDPLSSLIARAVVEEYTGALKKGLHVQEKLVKLVRKTRGLPVFNSNKDHFNFYAKYMRQVDSYEYKGVNEKGEPEYHYVKRWGFHEEYKWDDFYKAKRTMEAKIGPAPSKNDTVKWEAWKKQRDAWYAQNTVSTGTGTIPSNQYKNADFAALQGDQLFVELYKAYKDANNKAGKAGLKYGIIPQTSTVNLKVEKGKVAQTVLEKVRLFIGEEDQVYFSQKNNLKEKKNVPLGMTRMLDENELSFDLLNAVAKYSVSANKYNSISMIEPHVNILKNFIGGNASLSIDSRQVVKTTANGLKALSKAERKAMQVEATRINEQLDSFLNDVIYGQPMKKAAIQMFNSKFRVEDKNGKVEVIKGFSDMAEHIGIPDLDYHGFKVGEERKLKDYKVTMVRKDWNWSVKKSANTLGLITAFQQLALNPVAGVINVARAKLETYIEAVGGRYFGIKDALSAEGIYFAALGRGDFFEDLKGGKPSFLSEMLIEYDAVQGELYNELGKKISGSLANKLFRRNHMFFMQQGGEHYVQSQMMIAMMLHQKVKTNTGETLSLYDAKQREYKGTLKMADTDWTSQKDEDFRQTVKFVNTNMHGNYNKLDKAMLQRSWWGSLLLMFRKHIYTGFASRYRAGYVNYQTGNYTEGYYRTFFKGLVKQIQGLIEQRRMGQLSPDEKYAFRKIAADFAALVLLMFAFKAFDDDDDKEEFNDYMALISRRLISEGVQYTPVVGTMDLAKVVTNPAASVSTVDKVWDALSQSISDPTAEYERSGPGYEIGQNKAAVKWGRAIPVYRQYINTVEPERLLKFYGKNSIWFLKPSAKQNEDDE